MNKLFSGRKVSKISKIDTHTRRNGFLLMLFSVFFAVSLATYNIADGCFNVISGEATRNLCGKLGAYFADAMYQIFGYPVWLAMIWLLSVSVRMVVKIQPKYPIFRGFYTLLTICASDFLITLLELKIKFPIQSGGLVGYKINTSLPFGELKFAAAVVSAIVVALFPYVFLVFGKKTRKQIEKENKKRIIPFSMSLVFYKIIGATRFIVRSLLKFFKVILLCIIKIRLPEITFFKERRENRIKKRNKKIAENNNHKKVGDYNYPSSSLLKNIEQNNSVSVLKSTENVGKLKRILGEFGIQGEVVGFKNGPIVTLYEFKPRAGIKSSRIIGLSDDIARMMMVSSVRISTISGRDTLGIEVPNEHRSIVCFRKLIESEEYQQSTASLPMILGCNIFGKPVITDLTSMPHLLIAGTTGSGKSVGVNGMILSMLYRLRPDECKFIMIDPKMLEFSLYEGIPHLMMPVITEPKRAILALQWVVGEMERRYRAMSDAGVRNIIGYNQKVAKMSSKQQEEAGMFKMPYIVVIIDEMADLMIVAGKEIDVLVQRLSQMARAAGIHLIMATQRPSVDVITGVIKANFPTRISYQVSSKFDSRTILGEQGAEQLLGKGDNLFMMGGSKIMRVHGPLIVDDEVENVINFLKTQGQPEYIELQDQSTSDNDGFNSSIVSGGDGDIYQQAVNIVLRDKKTSISYLQRKMRIGYNKAANLIEQMEEEGILSAPDTTGKRVIVGE